MSTARLLHKPWLHLSLAGLLASFVACGEGAGSEPVVDDPPHRGRRDAGAQPTLDATAPEAGLPPQQNDAGVDADTGLPLESVVAPRELRGVWISTVLNIDFPKAEALTPPAGMSREQGARLELGRLVDRAAVLGLNAIFFQVRPESDAFYASSLEPWSRFATGGAQGTDPGYDPLALLLELAHARGIEVHAWINPYRGLYNRTTTAAANHITRTLPGSVVSYNGSAFMNPASPEVRAQLLAVLDDLSDRYAIDGLHYDDYFYPYPDADRTPFPDEPSYQAYRSGGGTLSKSDWRRENVNTLVRESMQHVAAAHPQLRFGISPFGIFRPGTPAGVTGLDAYEVLACDAPRWIREGWVDYLAPQLYWATFTSGQPFGTLMSYWAGTAVEGRHVFAGHGAYRLGSSNAWNVAELALQVQIARGQAPAAAGSIFFAATAMMKPELTAVFQESLYAEPALVPELPRPEARIELSPLQVEVLEPNRVQLAHAEPERVRFLAVFVQREGEWHLQRVQGMVAELELDAGHYALAAVGSSGVLSQARVLEVP